MMMLPLIWDFQEKIRPDKYTAWTMRLLRQHTGIKYQDVYRLERMRVIAPVRRADNGWLVWSPAELQKFLERVEAYLRVREDSTHAM